MSEKKRNLVFFQAVMSHGWFVMEKTKNENLIVHAGCGENRFSFFEFPDYLPDAAFDPWYAERVAGECYGSEIPGGWYDAAVLIVGNFDLWGATCAEFSSSRDEIDYLRRSHDGVVESLKGLADAFVKMEKSLSEPRDAVPTNPVPEPASLPPGFVAVPLPDDDEPVLGFKRKPGHYLTRGGYFVDLTYNVGTGIGQHEFPWVHFDKHRRGNRYDVFFTVHGEAYQATRVGSGVFPLCHYDHLPDFDIVQKCVHPAAEECGEELKAGAKFVVAPDQPLQAVVPVEHYNQATGQFSKFRGEVGQAFAMLAKAFGVCDCRCGESRKAGS